MRSFTMFITFIFSLSALSSTEPSKTPSWTSYSQAASADIELSLSVEKPYKLTMDSYYVSRNYEGSNECGISYQECDDEDSSSCTTEWNPKAIINPRVEVINSQHIFIPKKPKSPSKKCDWVLARNIRVSVFEKDTFVTNYILRGTVEGQSPSPASVTSHLGGCYLNSKKPGLRSPECINEGNQYGTNRIYFDSGLDFVFADKFDKFNIFKNTHLIKKYPLLPSGFIAFYSYPYQKTTGTIGAYEVSMPNKNSQLKSGRFFLGVSKNTFGKPISLGSFKSKGSAPKFSYQFITNPSYSNNHFTHNNTVELRAVYGQKNPKLWRKVRSKKCKNKPVQSDFTIAINDFYDLDDLECY